MRRSRVQPSTYAPALALAVHVLLGCWLAGCHEAAVDSHERHRRSRDAGRAEDGGDVDASAADAGDPPDAASSDPDATGDAASTSSPWTPQTRWILTGEIENARDLGGVPVGTSASVRFGRLFRGPPLTQLTAAGCSEFVELGIRTVIDLRIASERELAPEAPCVQNSASVVAAPLPIPYSVSPADYLADLDAAASMAAILEKLADPEAYPIYFHCTWGRDRTGVVAAVVLKALGASRADIMQEYLLSQPIVGAYPVSLQAVLDVIDQRGGIAAHLAHLGVPKHHLTALQSELVNLTSDD